MSSDLNDIIFQDVEGFPQFGDGQYADLGVVIMKENGYVNAPKLLTKIGTIDNKKIRK